MFARLGMMTLFDWVAAVIVVTSFVYLSFVLTLKEWIEGLRKGQAVTLLPAHGGRETPVWANLALVLVGLGLAGLMLYFLWIPFVRLSSSASSVLAVIGLTVYLIGLWFVLWARRTLGRNWGLSTSRQVKLLDDHVLIQGGPFAFVRHPMYFG
jgi:protein-S-isoprenylcysteine O-methyltransferase Ste14